VLFLPVIFEHRLLASERSSVSEKSITRVVTVSNDPLRPVNPSLADNRSHIAQITLPIYPYAQVIEHLNHEIIVQEGVPRLPTAILYSDHSLDKIVHFYDAHLGRYTKKKFTDGTVIYMLNISQSYHSVSDINDLHQQPHVMLKSFVDNNGVKKSFIEIAYN